MIGTLTAGTISGTVMGSDGVYLEEMFVEAYLYAGAISDMPDATCFTNEEGAYQFNDIENGTYLIRAGAMFNTTVPQFYDGVYHFLDATQIVISDSSMVVNSIDFILEYYSLGNSISGTITNEDNEPVANAEAIITRQVGYYSWNYSDCTNDNGEYTIDMIQAGIYSFKVEADGYEDYCVTDTTVTLEFTEDTVIENYDVVMTALSMYEVSGTVRDSETGSPIEYALVVSSSNVGSYNATAETDNNGEFTFVLIEGDYKFYASLGDVYEIQYYDHQNSVLNATIVNVNSDLTDIDFDLNHFGQFQNSISGTIFDNGAIPQYPVDAVAVSSDQEWEATAEVLSNGSYTLQNLPNNEYYILAVPQTQAAPPTYYEDVIVFEDATPVIADGNITGININLNSTQGSGFINISGIVTNVDGNPVANTSVIFNNSQGNVEGCATTNNDGFYEISNLILDDYEAIATKIFYETDYENMMVFEDGNADFVINSVLTNADKNDIPVATGTLSNYPNPFNPETNILFSTKESGLVVVEIFNVKGQLVKTLVNDRYDAGNHSVIWSGNDDNGKTVVSGIYFYKMQTNSYSKTQKMILMK